MIDTGADISVLKDNSDTFNDINIDNKINIQGINQGLIQSKGLTSLEIQTTKYIIPHNFHIVESTFSIPCDGILGIDFIKKYNCQLDFTPAKYLLIIRPDNLNYPIYVPINYSSGNNTIVLSARSEVVRKIELTSNEDSILIPNQEIQPGIYAANTVVTTANAFVRLLNTTSTDQMVNVNKLNYEPLANYDISEINNETRTNNVMSKLTKNFPKLFHKELKELCCKYTDIFGLDTESITTNNFYKQKLRLKDDEPVYIKNYRNPHSQKDEIPAQVDKLIKDRIVEPSASEYNSPLLLEPKKSIDNEKKKWRLVIDYRQINKKELKKQTMNTHFLLMSV